MTNSKDVIASTDHPACEVTPVFLDSAGNVLPHAEGIRRTRRRLNLTVLELADAVGASARTVEGWEQGRPVPPKTLQAIGALLSPRPTRTTPKPPP